MTGILAASVVDIFLNGSGYEVWLEEPRRDGESGEWVHTARMEWPGWGWALIVVLIGVSVLWIPAVAILRLHTQKKKNSLYAIHFIRLTYGLRPNSW